MNGKKCTLAPNSIRNGIEYNDIHKNHEIFEQICLSAENSRAVFGFCVYICARPTRFYVWLFLFIVTKSHNLWNNDQKLYQHYSIVMAHFYAMHVFSDG